MDREKLVETGTYLVTGGAGFIGTNFVRHLRARYPKASVTVLDKLTYAGNPANLAEFEGSAGYRFVRGDIADEELVGKLMAEGFDFVLNFAAETHVLLEAVRRHAATCFIQISTDEVYGEVFGEPVDEEAPLKPRNPYAASKSGGDRLAFSYHATYGLPVVITRCSNNYGPYQYPEKLIPLFVTNALEDKPLPVYGTGRNVRDWIHVEDHVLALDALLRVPGCEGEVFNIGAYNEKDVLTIADRILATLGKPKELLRHVVDRPGHDRRYAIAWEKLKERTGWEPRHDFDEGIAETIRWYREQPDWWRPLKSGEFLEYYKRNYAFEAGDEGTQR